MNGGCRFGLTLLYVIEVNMTGKSIYLLVALYLFGFANTAYCPDGYCRHSTNCYLVVGLNVTYIDAKAYCGIFGGHLLKITSQAHQYTAAGVMKKSETMTFPGNFWLDSTDLLNPGDFKWMSDKSSLSYANWSPGYPLGQNTTENCLAMLKDDQYRWRTVSCEEKNNFVCYTAGRRSYNQYSRYGQSSDTTPYCLPEPLVTIV